MRKFLFATSALAALALAGAASAQSQTNGSPIVANVNVNNVNVAGLADLNAQGVGNSINAEGAINLELFTAPGHGQVNLGAISSVLNLNNSSFSSDAEVGSLSVGNTISADIGGTLVIGGADVAHETRQRNGANITAFTNIDGSTFGNNLAATSVAVGNNLSATGNFTDVGGILDIYDQSNSALISSTLEISNSTTGQTGLNYGLTGGATSIANNIDLGSSVTSGPRQTAEGTVRSLVDLDNVNMRGNGNALTAQSVGNAFQTDNGGGAFGVYVMQGGSATIRADFDMDNSYAADGDFAAVAVMNMVDSVGGRFSQGTGVGQSISSDIDVNNSGFGGGVSVGATSIGNFADLTDTGALGQQVHFFGSITASADVNSSNFGGGTSVNATAAGNVANIAGSWTTVGQNITGTGQTITSGVNINNSNFGGGLNVGSAAIGNSLNFGL